MYQLLSALRQQIVVATNNTMVFDAPLEVHVGLYWPPLRTLQNLTKMAPPGSLVSVYDRKSAHDTTRWIPTVVAQKLTPTLLTSSPTTQLIPPGGTATVTLGGSTTSGDAVSLVASNRGSTVVLDPADGSFTQSPTAAVVYALSSRDDVFTAATRFAAAVSADPVLGTWLTVTVSGSTLSLTNRLPTTMSVASYTGNGGTQTTEIGRRRRDLQITTWAPSPEIRDAVSAPLETLIAQLEVFADPYQSGLVLGDGSFARMTHHNDFLVDDGMLADLYRRDFIWCADYPVTTTDALYSVLAPVMQYNITA